MISFPVPTWPDDLKLTYHTDSQIQDILARLKAGTNDIDQFTLQNGLLLYKGKVYIGVD